MSTMDTKSAWSATVAQLKTTLSAALREALDGLTIREQSDGRFLLVAQDAYAISLLRERAAEQIQQTLARTLGRSARIDFIVAKTGVETDAQEDGDELSIDAATGTRYEREVKPDLIVAFPGYALRLLQQGDLSPLEMSLWVGFRQACFRRLRRTEGTVSTKIAYNDIIDMANTSKPTFFRAISGKDEILGGMARRLPSLPENFANPHIDNATAWQVSLSPRLTKRDAAVIESILADYAADFLQPEGKREGVLNALRNLAIKPAAEWLADVPDVATDNAPKKVVTIVRRTLGIEGDMPADLFEAAEALQSKLMRSFGSVIVTHHFLKTAPVFGLSQAQMWAIIALRHRRFYDHDTGEEFDYVYARKGVRTLSQWAGVSKKSLMRWLKDPVFSAFVRQLPVAPEYLDEEPTAWERGGGEVYAVRGDEPPLWFEESDNTLIPHWTKWDTGRDKVRHGMGQSDTRGWDKVRHVKRLILKTHLKLLTTTTNSEIVFLGQSETGLRAPGYSGYRRQVSPQVAAPPTPVSAVPADLASRIVSDAEYGELVRAMESIYGSINMATADFLDDLLADWNHYRGKLPAGHPDAQIAPFEAVLAAIREGIANARNARPSHKYIRAILMRWTQDGFKKSTKTQTKGTAHGINKKSGRGDGRRKAAASVPPQPTEEDRRLAEQIKARRTARRNGAKR